MKEMVIGNRTFDLENGYYIMGILNVTPDSFSDGGKWDSLDRARAHALAMAEEGADIIDIGGESTRPGHQQITEEEEIARVLPVIEAVKKDLDLPVSLDTYKSNVARAGIEAGADLLNDIWGFKYDEAMPGVVAKAGISCALMHNRNEAGYSDIIAEMKRDLEECVALAKNAGIADNRIMIDPGVGFGKTYEDNLQVMNALEEFTGLGYPLLLGTSRKSMIGNALDLPADQRVEGTVATSVIGVMKGARFFRVHDVKENLRAIKMTQAIIES